MVRKEGVEPSRVSPLAPEASAYSDSATSANIPFLVYLTPKILSNIKELRIRGFIDIINSLGEEEVYVFRVF